MSPHAGGPGGRGLQRGVPAGHSGQGGLAAEARAGVVERPTHWPPEPGADDCTNGVFEDSELAKSLGFSLDPVVCPWAGMAPVPVLGGPAPGDAPPEPSLGFGIHCYPLGEAVLVLETTERTGECAHVVGLALFPMGKP